MRLLWVALALFTNVVFTGLGLVFLYTPSGAQPATSAEHKAITMGGVVRGAHFWVSQMIGPVILLHLLLLVRRRGAADRKPKTGTPVALYLLAVLFWFTGTLLPWDQLAFWLAEAGRGAGVHLSLQQIYWAHVALLPVLTGMVLFLYVWRFRKGERSVSPGEATV